MVELGEPEQAGCIEFHHGILWGKAQSLLLPTPSLGPTAPGVSTRASNGCARAQFT